MAPRTLARQSFVGTKTVVAAATSVTALLLANPSRTGFSIFNDSTAILNIALTDDAAELTTLGPDVQIAAGGYYEAPTDWCGPVYGQWVSANGNARIKEFK